MKWVTKKPGLGVGRFPKSMAGYDCRGMTSQWAPVGAGAGRLRRARELREAGSNCRRGALGPELLPRTIAGLRPTIVELWRRRLPQASIRPTCRRRSRPTSRRCSSAGSSIRSGRLLTSSRSSSATWPRVARRRRVTDASGLVLHRVGRVAEGACRRRDEPCRGRAVQRDSRRHERDRDCAGRRPRLPGVAFEHFNELHHQWICSGAPVHDPVSGQVVGLIDLSSLWTAAHPYSLELVPPLPERSSRTSWMPGATATLG